MNRIVRILKPRRIANPARVLLLAVPSLVPNMDNFDLKLKEACDKGDAAIVELMDNLKNNFTQLSKAYKDCLNKQIQIIDEATKAGASSSKWDDLPQFRTMAKDLNDDFQKFIITINTLGSIAQNKTLQFITKQEKQFKLLEKKHQELEKIIKTQVEEIKKIEQKLLAKTKTSIDKH